MGIPTIVVIPTFHPYFPFSLSLTITLTLTLTILYNMLLLSFSLLVAHPPHTSSPTTTTLYSIYILITPFSFSSPLVLLIPFLIIPNLSSITTPIFLSPHPSFLLVLFSIVVLITIFFNPLHTMIPPILILFTISFFLLPILTLLILHILIMVLISLTPILRLVFRLPSLSPHRSLPLSLTFPLILIQAITTVVTNIYVPLFSSFRSLPLLFFLCSSMTLIVILTTILQIISILILPYIL